MKRDLTLTLTLTLTLSAEECERLIQSGIEAEGYVFKSGSFRIQTVTTGMGMMERDEQRLTGYVAEVEQNG